MRRVECPDCERVLKVADDTEATMVRCPGCGRKVALEDEEREADERIVEEKVRPAPRRQAVEEPEDQEEDEPRRKRRSSKPARSGSWALPRGKMVDVEDGRVVPRSLLKTIFKMNAGWILIVIGLFCLAGGFCAILASFGLLKSNDSPLVTVLCGVGMLVLALGLFVVGGITTWVDIARLLHKERLVLGDTYVQRVIDKAEATLQVAYANIDTIRLESKIVGTGRNRYQYYFIGIRIKEIRNKDTIVNKDEVKHSLDQHDFDVSILDEYRGSLESLYTDLVERWKETLRDEDDDAAHRRIREHDRYEKDRRWRAGWSKSITLVVVIVLGGLFVLGCGGMGVALVAQWLGLIRTGPPPAPPAPGPVVNNQNPWNPNPNEPKPNEPKPNEPKPEPPPRVTGDESIDRALADIGDKGTSKRNAGLESLAKMQANEQHRSTVAARIAALADVPETYTRQKAIEALGVWGTPKEVPVLIKALKDSDTYTRQLALKALPRFKDERSVAPMVECLRKLETKYWAGKTLREMGPLAEKEVAALLKEDDYDLRSDAIGILKDIGTQESVPALEGLLTDPKAAGVQPAAREALKTIKARSNPQP
jgi:hypothetical protein